MTLAQLSERRAEILAVAEERGSSNVRVFGSVARAEAVEGCDIDFLVDLEPGRTLLDLGGLLMDLRDLLGHDVDVMPAENLRPRIANDVLADAVAL